MTVFSTLFFPKFDLETIGKCQQQKKMVPKMSCNENFFLLLNSALLTASPKKNPQSFISTIVETIPSLWTYRTNRFLIKSRLISSLDSSLYQLPTVELLVALFDNYDPDESVSEDRTDQEVVTILEFQRWKEKNRRELGN